MSSSYFSFICAPDLFRIVVTLFNWLLSDQILLRFSMFLLEVSDVFSNIHILHQVIIRTIYYQSMPLKSSIHSFINPDDYSLLRILFHMVQLDLNLMLACAVPASKNTFHVCTIRNMRFLLIYMQTKFLVCNTRAHCTRRRKPRYMAFARKHE